MNQAATLPASTALSSYRTALNKTDLAAIRALLVATDVFNDEEVAIAIELAEDTFTKKEKSDYHFVLAEIEGQLAGYTCHGRIPFTDGRYDLYWIATDPKSSARGVASALLAHTETLIRKAGGKHVYAETSSRAPYAPAHAFYKKNGYIHVATLKDFYRDGDDKLVFSKII